MCFSYSFYIHNVLKRNVYSKQARNHIWQRYWFWFVQWNWKTLKRVTNVKKKRFYIMLTHILGESLKQKYSLHMPVFCVFLFNSHGVGCLCHNGNIQCFINIGQQLSPTDGGWRQKLGQVGSLWTGWHRRVHWNKTKRWHINSRSYQLVT